MSSRAEPDVEVVIVHWNAPSWCASSVDSMLKSIGVNVRCTIVDNASTHALDGVPPNVETIHLAENLGYAGAANVGLGVASERGARSRYVAVAAHDALVEPECLRAMTDLLDSELTLGLVGPVLSAPSRSTGGVWRGWRARTLTELEDPGASVLERDWLSGTLIVGRHECFDQLGGFDARLGSYVEDVDICLRARDAGWRVGVLPAARARGQGSASSSVTVHVDVNSVFVAAKRNGLRIVPGIVMRYVFWMFRGTVAALWPRRSATRRQASWEHVLDHGRALRLLFGQPRRLWQFARSHERCSRTSGA